MPTTSHNKQHVLHLDQKKKKAVESNSHNYAHQGYTYRKRNLVEDGWVL